MDRKLASIQRIVAKRPIEGADNIEVVQVLGWECVTQKSNNLQVGDLVVYFEVDSVLPQTPQFEFLADRNYRIKTIRLRGQVSQGLILPLDDIKPEGFTHSKDFFTEGLDVTELLGVKKYEIPIAAEMEGQIEGAFPGWISKTDETRIQSSPKLLNEITGLAAYATQKDDGTSATYGRDVDGKLIVASRNLSLKPTNNIYWRMAEKYNLAKHLEFLGNVSALQGEIVGPGIQGNKLGLKEHELHIFTVTARDNPNLSFLDYRRASQIAANGLQFVDVLWETDNFQYTLAELLELAKGKYASGQHREGIVIRPKVPLYSKILNGTLSFKVLNNDYLLKEK